MGISVNRTGRQRGAVAIAVAVGLLVLLGIAGLALDLGQLFVTKTELQNAMDACALAAAQELNTVNASAANRLLVLTRAESAGIDVAKRNSARFQREVVTLVSDRDVMFSAALAGPWTTKSAAPANTQYVRCSTRRSGIETWLMNLPGFDHDTEDVQAMATASLQPGVAACVLPLGICKVPGSPLVVGNWYPGKFEVPCDQGVCNYLDIEGLTHSASELGAAIRGPGLCGISIGAQAIEAKTGNMESLDEDWNSRFGIYKADCGTNSPNWDDNPPDHTGYAFTQKGNWPSGSNAYSATGGFLEKRAAHAAYDSNAGVDFGKPKCITGQAKLAEKGTDRRLVYLPIIDCPWDGHTTNVRGVACVLLLTPMGKNKNVHPFVVEYLGEAPSEACGTSGTPGGPGGTGPRVPTLVQ